MDSNKKSGWWVGNICNQFEAIFQDVDNLARKEAVKFVANQVYSVGDNVKRLYSDVVQDVPSPEENVKLLERSETSTQVDTGSHVELDAGTSTKPVCITKEDQVLVEKGSFNAPKNSNYHMTEDNTFEDCINEDVIQATANTEYNPNLSEAYCKPKNMVASSSLSLSEEEDLLALHFYNMSFSCDNESRSNINEDFIQATANIDYSLNLSEAYCKPKNMVASSSLSEEEALLALRSYMGFSCDNESRSNINEDVIQATANTDYNLNLSEAYCKTKNMVASSSLSISEEEELLALHEYMAFSCDNESRPNISTDDCFYDGTPDINAPNSTPMVVSVLRDCEENIPAFGLLLSSDSDADVWGHTTDLVSPYSSCGDEEADMGDVSSSCTASQKALNSNEFVSEDFIEQAKKNFICHVESACTSIAPSSSTLAYETYALDTLSVMDSNDANSFSSSESVSNIARSQSQDECCHEDAQSKSISSPSEVMDIPLVIGSNDLKSLATSKPVSVAHQYQRPGHCHEDAQSISASSHSERGNSSEFGCGIVDHGMETIDLSDDVKYDGRDLVLNRKFVVPSTHRRRNFRYYKGLLKDALASRKRLSREYELLGLHHSDIDKESRHNFNPSTVHSVRKSVNEIDTEPSDMCESDWELL